MWWYEQKSLEEKIEQHERYIIKGMTPADFRMIYLLTENAGAFQMDPEECTRFCTAVNYAYQLPHEDDIPMHIKKMGEF